jgi:hypothetical protein
MFFDSHTILACFFFSPFPGRTYFVSLLHEQYHWLFLYVPPKNLLNLFVPGIWVDMLDGRYAVIHSS